MDLFLAVGAGVGSGSRGLQAYLEIPRTEKRERWSFGVHYGVTGVL